MIFHTDSLISKWGFDDGDILENFAFNNNLEFEYDPDKSHSGSHSALIKLVCEHILPKLDQEVIVQEISCIHNPIRALTVNGRDASAFWHESFSPPFITPATIYIPNEIVLEIVKEFSVPISTGTPPA